ncbi:hypothetical protein RCL1_003385 [Eukaryota sp. TZLM3-RCL]
MSEPLAPLLSVEVVDLDSLRNLVYGGYLQFVPHFRPLVWSLLLGSIPPRRSSWESTLNSRRSLYCGYASDFWHEQQPKSLDTLGDHPLSSCDDSHYASFFVDRRLLYEICKDIRRTHSNHNFFKLDHTSPTNQSSKPVLNTHKSVVSKTAEITEIADSQENAIDALISLVCSSKVHCVMLRILFLFAKLNPAIKYIQGMNELLSPIFYTFETVYSSFNQSTVDSSIFSSDLWSSEVIGSQGGYNVPITAVEADVFFVFNLLMSKCRDNFIESLDHDSRHGIRSKMMEIQSIIQRFDCPLINHFKSLSVDPQYFALRWVSVLLSQDFSLADTVRVWDSLFAINRHMDVSKPFILYICSAMILIIRDDLIKSDFPTLLSKLQRYESNENLIESILDYARKIYMKDTK